MTKVQCSVIKSHITGVAYSTPVMYIHTRIHVLSGAFLLLSYSGCRYLEK